MAQLVLYGTAGCHLCEIAAQLVSATVDLNAFPVEEIDISESDTMLETYGVRIPVLADVDSGLELGWPFDHDQLSTFIDSI